MHFYELLQVALGNRECLSRVPSDDEWSDLYDETERQAVTGILLQGIERLPAEQRPQQFFLLQWIGVGQIIEQQNHLLDERCMELLRRTQDAGLHGTICGYQALKDLLQPDEVGVFLETAHPAKFKDTVEPIIGTKVEIPERLAVFMRGNKQSVELSKNYIDFKAFLMKA